MSALSPAAQNGRDPAPKRTTKSLLRGFKLQRRIRDHAVFGSRGDTPPSTIAQLISLVRWRSNCRWARLALGRGKLMERWWRVAGVRLGSGETYAPAANGHPYSIQFVGTSAGVRWNFETETP